MRQWTRMFQLKVVEWLSSRYLLLKRALQNFLQITTMKDNYWVRSKAYEMYMLFFIRFFLFSAVYWLIYLTLAHVYHVYMSIR